MTLSTLTLLFLFFYAAMIGLMYVFQRRLMYSPVRAIGTPEEYGLSGFSEYLIPSTGGITIQLWYRAASAGYPTIVHFHGNAYHIGNRADIYAQLANQGFGVLGVSYRGYGKSGGSPYEAGLYDDARAAIAFLTETQHIPIARIMLYGESLGTGVAVQMATEYDITALVLQAPYLSVAGRAAEIYRFVPVRWLIHDRYESFKKIARVKAPLLVFHGELDATIPVAHGKKLFEAAASPKRGVFFPGKSHYDFDSHVISAHVSDFAREHRLIG